MPTKSKPLENVTHRKHKRTVGKRTKLQLALAKTNAVILDALPAHIALVDSKGVILYVNKAWSESGTTSLFTGTTSGIGANYIQGCMQGNRKLSYEGQAISQGLQKVLDGTQKSFTLEYPCPTQTNNAGFV